MEIGQKVYIVRHGSWNTHYRSAKVVKISKEGRVVTVENASGYQQKFINGHSAEKFLREYLLEEVGRIEDILRERVKQNQLNLLFVELEKKARNKEIEGLKEIITKIEEFKS